MSASQVDLHALDSPTLYRIEQGSRAEREAARETLDARVIQWTAVDGWTQRQIADEIGCSFQAISKRQTRLGVPPSQPKKKQSVNQVDTSKNGSTPEPRPGVNKWSRAVQRVSEKCPIKQLTVDELAELHGAATFLSHYCSGEQVRRQGNNGR